jgi:hypothetical protein
VVSFPDVCVVMPLMSFWRRIKSPLKEVCDVKKIMYLPLPLLFEHISEDSDNILWGVLE